MSTQYVPLGSLVEVNPRLPKEERENPSQPVSFVPMDAVSEEGYVRAEEERSLGDVLKGYTYFERGDVLLAKITPCLENGKAALADSLNNRIGYGTTEFHVLRPKKGIDPRFLFHQVWNPRFRFFAEKAMKGAAGQKRVGADFFERYQVPDLGHVEQKRIAAILDKADANRRKRQQAIQLADEFIRSVFLEMFGDPVSNTRGWKEQAIGKSVEEIVAGWSANGDSSPAADGQLGVLKISAVTSGEFVPSENKAVEVSVVPDGKALVIPRTGDLLFSRANTRELVAATALVEEDCENLFLPDKLWRIRFAEEMLPEFFHYLLRHPRMRARLTSRATGTSGSMLNISKKKFEETMAILPSVSEQERFVSIFRKIRAYRRKLVEFSCDASELLGSLSRSAFEGKL